MTVSQHVDSTVGTPTVDEKALTIRSAVADCNGSDYKLLTTAVTLAMSTHWWFPMLRTLPATHLELTIFKRFGYH